MRLLAGSLLFSALVFAGDVAGNWNVSADAPDGRVYKFTMTVQGGENPSVKLVSPQGTIPGRKVKITGDELVFEVPNPQVDYVTIQLKLDGDKLTGTLKTPQGDMGTITGARAEAAPPAPVPAGAAPSPEIGGVWKILAETGGGREAAFILTLEQSGGKVNGRIGPEGDDTLPIEGAELKGNQLIFKIATDGGTYTVEGTIEGTSMKGTYKAGGSGGAAFKATKIK